MHDSFLHSCGAGGASTHENGYLKLQNKRPYLPFQIAFHLVYFRRIAFGCSDGHSKKVVQNRALVNVKFGDVSFQKVEQSDDCYAFVAVEKRVIFDEAVEKPDGFVDNAFVQFFAKIFGANLGKNAFQNTRVSRLERRNILRKFCPHVLKV